MRLLALVAVLACACSDNNGGSGGTGGSSGATGTGGSSGSGGTGGSGCTGSGGSSSGNSVIEHHGNPARTGMYVAPNLTKTAAATLAMDGSFHPTVMGPTYAQPLYVDAGSGGRDLVIVATEQNQVSAFHADDGSPAWQRVLTAPRPLNQQPCGNIDPLGITGTPYVDLGGRTVYLDAMTTENNAAHHKVYALGLDDGMTKSGWPVDANASFHMGSITFDSSVQNQRGALAMLNGVLYVPYGGHFGDCGAYHGWVVGIPVNNPSGATAYATADTESGIWAPSGIASDGCSLFVCTGNGSGASWGGSEMLARLTAGPVFSAQPSDYWVPTNWQSLDHGDVDLGGTGPVVLDVPGAGPSQLVAAFGKDGKVYLLGRSNMGGIGSPVASLGVTNNVIINASAAYRTATASYVVMRASGNPNCPGGQSGNLVAVKITAASPPAMSVAWCANSGGRGSPMVTTSDGTSDAIVWIVGAESDNTLHGYDGDTGQSVVSVAGFTSVRRFVTPIYAKGRIFVAADDAVYAFKTN